MKLKKIIFAASLLAAVFAVTASDPSPAAAAGRRTTLFVVVGHKKLAFEAPVGMCFLDPGSRLQGMIYDSLRAGVEGDGQQIMLGAFMDCGNISSPDAWTEGMPDTGVIAWLNPAVGETTPMSRADYLDMREATFLSHARTLAGGMTVDKKLHRTENNVAVGMSSAAKNPPPEHRGTNILVTTVLNHVPIEVTFHYNGNPAPAAAAFYGKIDTFVAQQIALNELK